MKLLDALIGLGKGAANATGLPYLINSDIINPIKQSAAQLTGNRQAYANTQRKMDNELTLKKLLPNAAGALSLPFALEGASKMLWRQPETAGIPFVRGDPNLTARVGPNARYTMGDVGEYKLNNRYLNPKDWNGINQSARELSNKYNIDLVNGSPANINARIAEFLNRFNGM